MLGGQISQYEYNRAIWLIKCNPKENRKVFQNETSFTKSLKLFVEVEKISIEGPEPSPRVFQTAIFYDKYIAMFGGRNESKNDCLNDIILLDISLYRWQPIVVYGFIPSKRWGHAMGVQNDSILILGGVGEAKLASLTVYKLEMNRKFIRDNLIECKRIKTILEIEARKINMN